MHCALRCLPATTTALTFVGPSQFSLVHEGAAGRVWLRRVSSHTMPYARGAAFMSSESIKSGRARGIFNMPNKITSRHPHEGEIDRDVDGFPAELTPPSAYRIAANSQASAPWAAGPTYPPANNTEALLPDFSLPRTTHSPTSGASTISSLPLPLSPQTFHDNLRFASHSKPPPNVEELVNYHDSRPHFQSPETYNICIKFAINHGQYDIANRLFDAMTKAAIYFDSVTSQLLVRLHARQFLEQVEDSSDRPILRKGSTTAVEILSITRGSHLEIEPEEFLRRILNCLRPFFSGWEVHPKIIKAALYAIVERNMTLAASELASVYFSSLPTLIDQETKRHCLDMIHLLLSINSKGGTIVFVDNRRLLLSLLNRHRSLQPTSQTLFLLLAPLKTARHRGTVALKVIESFRRSWGNGIVDDRVRERVIRLAKKEGRPDIVKRMKAECM